MIYLYSHYIVHKKAFLHNFGLTIKRILKTFEKKAANKNNLGFGLFVFFSSNEI
jgi:hypothetical protein